ncbi:hypothetical protein VQ643_06580 [Pseudomonas sp. F1_0610]|uniref:hypothetical protein n=1 Tax=Pseudomonas sp. F1_0610 TaxID=3114284 RepID=UPI0039C3F5B2
MKTLSLRAVLLSLICALLTACQTTSQPSAVKIDEFAIEQQVFNQYLQAGDLAFATEQLLAIEENTDNAENLAQMRKQLADAWLVRGQQAINDKNLEQASHALTQAKQLLPNAPALTVDLSKALGAAQAKSRALQNRRAAASAQAVKPKAKEEPVEPVVITKPSEKLVPSLKVAKIVSLEVLDTSNDSKLLNVLDKVAADVIKHHYTIVVEVRNTRDFHWVVALLMPRVKKNDQFYQPKIVEVIKPEQVPQIVLSEKL